MKDRIAIGGLMRCCVQTLHEHIAEHPVSEEGTRLQCKYGSSWMYRDSAGIWRWENPRDGMGGTDAEVSS